MDEATTAVRGPTPLRVLVPITVNFAVRAVVRTGLAASLRAFCEPVLAVSWDDDEVSGALRDQGFEVLRLPDAQVGQAVHQAMLPVTTAFQRRLRTPTAEIDCRRRDAHHRPVLRARRWAERRRAELATFVPGSGAKADAALDAAITDATNVAELQAFLAEHRIGAVFTVTPYAVQELVLLHAAARAGLPRTTSLLSFDNLTTRPPLPVEFLRYAVWNRHMVGELLRSYPYVDRDRVDIVGPAQMDFYRQDEFAPDEEAWRSRLGVVADRPSVLFGAGPTNICPNETQFLDDLLAGVADGRLPADLQLVLRRHPHDAPERWERFRDHPSITFDEPGAIGKRALRPGEVGYDDEQIVALRATLELTDVHVNVSSTMTLDGAVFDKPQIGPAYDRVGTKRDERAVVDLYAREHFLPIVASGGLELARTPSQLVELVASALRDPGRLRSQRATMVTEMCTVIDGGAAGRIAASVHLAFADAGLVAP